MQDTIGTAPQVQGSAPWNKGKLIGAKPPLRPKHIWSIRTKLQLDGRTRPVRFELTEQTRQAVDEYLKTASKKPGEFLFSGRGGPGRCMTTRQYARLVSSGSPASGWIRTSSGRTHFDEPRRLSSIAIRAICEPYSCCAATPRIESTVRYVGIEVDDALTIAEQVEV